LKQAADLLIADLDTLLAVLKRRAFEHKLTPTIGRSHGIHAEPVTFGLKLAQAFAEFARNRSITSGTLIGHTVRRRFRLLKRSNWWFGLWRYSGMVRQLMGRSPG